MKVAAGLVLIIAGIALGIYVGLWLMIVGGIIQVVNAFQVDPVSAPDVAIGIMRFWFGGAAGVLVGVIPCIFGAAVLND